MIDVNELRKMNRVETIAVTKHAKERMDKRGISIDDIVSCISFGQIIKQYEDDKPLASCLISGYGTQHIIIHTVVSCDESVIYLITAYYPDPNRWNSEYTLKKGC